MLQLKNKQLSANMRGAVLIAVVCALTLVVLAFFSPLASGADEPVFVDDREGDIGEGHFVDPEDRVELGAEYSLYEVGNFVYLKIVDGDEKTAYIYELSDAGYEASVLTIPHYVLLGMDSCEVVDIYSYSMIDNRAEKFEVAAGQTHFMTDANGSALYYVDEESNEPVVLVQFATKSNTSYYTLPKTVDVIFPGAVSGENLTGIAVERGNENYYARNGVLFQFGDGDYPATLIQYPVKKTGDSFVIQEVYVADYAFFGAQNLKNVSFTDVEIIGIQAFAMCPVLEKIEFSEGDYLLIDAEAFANCPNLGDLDFTPIKDSLFLASGAFMGCSSICTIKFSSMYTDLGKSFYYVDVGVFAGCTGLESVDFTGCWMLNIGMYCFTYYEGYYDACFNLSEIVWGESSVDIGDMAFADCDSLSYLVMDGAYYVGIGAFAYCDNLQYISLSDNVDSAMVTIDAFAFFGCEKLWYAEFYYPEIYSFAFYGCIAMESIAFLQEAAPTGEVLFSNSLNISDDVDINITVYSATVWFEEHIDESITGKKTTCVFHTGEFGYEGDISWMNCYDENTLYIYGDFLGGSKSVLTSLPTVTKGTVNTIVIGAGIREIDLGAANGPSAHYSVNSVILSEDLRIIGDYSFCNFDGIESITIPAKVERIGDYAFFGCTGMKEIVFEAKNPTKIKMFDNSFNLTGDSSEKVVCRIVANCDSRFLDDNIGMGDVDFDYANEKATENDIQKIIVAVCVVAGLILILILGIMYARRH